MGRSTILKAADRRSWKMTGLKGEVWDFPAGCRRYWKCPETPEPVIGVAANAFFPMSGPLGAPPLTSFLEADAQGG
jgi:hypothetical protein